MRFAGENGAEPSPKGTSEWRQRLRGVAARWLPRSWSVARIDPGRAGLLGLSLVGVVGFLIAVAGMWSDQPVAESTPPPPPTIAAPPSPSAEPAEIVVSVVGRVSRPGLVRIEDGSRVADALEAVGGALPGTDITRINLARKLVDGEQLYVAVPVPPGVEVPDDPSGRDAEPGERGSKVDLNAATEEDLDELPGVGEVTAERIVRWRTDNGPFESVEQLREVDGIGETRFSRLRDMVRV